MNLLFNHAWDIDPASAICLQKEFALKVQIEKPTTQARYIAGIDCAPSRDQTQYFAAIVIWDLKTRQIVEYHLASAKLSFPYIPGLLSFREIPAILEAIKKIKQEPDLIIVDGHGIAHPRALGIAAHLGVLIGKPTFGCGKSLLYGKYEEPGLERGSISPLIAKNTIIGNVVRTRSNVKPVIVSVGNKIDLETITELVLSCSGKYRLPEPTHLADKLVAQKQIKSVFMPESLFSI